MVDMQVWGIGSSQRLQDDLCAKTNKDKVKTGNRKLLGSKDRI